MIRESDLAAVRDRESLFALLQGQLGWGVDPDDAFTYDEPLPEGDGQPNIEVSRLVPFTGDDPFAIILAEFRSPFRRGALRKVLQAIRKKMRTLAAYQGKSLEDLIFVCAEPDYDGVRFARFREQEGRQPKLAVFGWQRAQVGETRTLRDTNLPALKLTKNLFGEPDWSEETRRTWESAWDVERVTRQFFTDYRTEFERVEEGLAGVIPAADRRRMYTQRLFNRLLFVAFIQKKGWLRFEGRTDYLAALLEAAERDRESFLNDRLYWAFFAGLGAHADLPYVQDDAQLIDRRGEVPFLNGGLFEMEDELDQRGAVAIPNRTFSAILAGPDALFNRYQFTITESTPDDVDVAVDPEMLGKVFEELVTGRHEQGAYYTPKQVVSFMCREALKCYLETELDETPREAIEAFVEAHDPQGLAKPEQVLQALRQVRVCDPACGSGAYLLGMLHELLDLRTCLFATKKIDPINNYRRKLEIIQRSLYGVDKDPFAVNIARLRLWLSLAVEYDGADPPPLPNLDFKIEAGDSLLGPAPTSQGTPDMIRQQMIEEFRDLKRRYLTAHGDPKRELRRQIDKVRQSIQEHEHRDGADAGFDWQVEFAEVFLPEEPIATIGGAMNLGQELAYQPRPGGFDVVVANPPYVRQELITAIKPAMQRGFPEVYNGVADLYVFFYARAHQLLAPGGVASVISSNKWLRAGYGEPLRCHLLDAQRCRLVVDFGDLPVFGAVAYPCISVWQRAPREGSSTWSASVRDLADCYDQGVAAHVAEVGETVPAQRFRPGAARLAPGAAQRERMEASGVTLGELADGRIFWGIKTGLNEAFIVDRATRDRLCAEDARSTDILKPLLRGDDVRRYELHFREQYLVFTRHGTRLADYPAIRRHLEPYRAELTPKRTARQPGPGRKPGRYAWHEIQDNVAYYDVFDEPKIVYPDIGIECRFAMDESCRYAANTVYVIALADWYLLGVLNTSHFADYLRAVSTSIRGGYLRFFGQFMTAAPVPEAADSDRVAVGGMAKSAQEAHGWRRAAVESFLVAIGLSASASTSRNILEQPWGLTETEFLAQAKRKRLAADVALFREVHNQTAELTEQIETIEAEIDERVAGLYGL